MQDRCHNHHSTATTAIRVVWSCAKVQNVASLGTRFVRNQSWAVVVFPVVVVWILITYFPVVTVCSCFFSSLLLGSVENHQTCPSTCCCRTCEVGADCCSALLTMPAQGKKCEDLFETAWELANSVRGGCGKLGKGVVSSNNMIR